MAPSVGNEVGLAAYVFLLVMAGLNDFRTLRIPNWLTAALAAAFPPVALMFGHHVDWLSHLGAGLAVFAGAAILFALRLMGGGDVKLLAAVALWTGLGQLLPFLALTMLIGGLFAILVLAVRAPTAQLAFLAVLRRLPAFAEGRIRLPYGIPIAAAGILMAPSLSFLA
jgi:prepilin peptidase CpaA